MSFTRDDERDYDRRQERHEAIEEERDRRKFNPFDPRVEIEHLTAERDGHAAERTRLAMLRVADQSEIAKLRGLLRALVEEIVDDGDSFRAPLCRSSCPECDEHSDQHAALCPYHAAKAALEE